jgi:iron complex transport system substrate-binding protein
MNKEKLKKISAFILCAALSVMTVSCASNSPSASGAAEPTQTSTEAADTAADASKKIVIEDQRGVTIEFDGVPERIAMTIMPLPAIYVAVAGSAERLIAMNPSSMIAYENSTLKYMFPDMANVSTEFVDTSFIVNIEEILKIQPDVVFQWTSQPEEIAKMENAGLKVIGLTLSSDDSLNDLHTWIRILGKLLDREEHAEEIIRVFNETVAEVDDVLKDLPNEERVNLISLSSDLRVAGRGFSTDFWMNRSGGINPAGNLTGDSLTVNMEQMFDWNPEVIYIGNFTDIVPSDLLDNKLPGEDWSLIQAVQDKRVYKIPIGGYRWDPPNVESPLMVKWMAQINHPSLFADMDMREEIRKFYKAVYDFEITDTMLDEILLDVQ